MIVYTSIPVRNAMLDAVEATVGTAPVLKIYGGTPPAKTADASGETALATFTLASDWADPASGGIKNVIGTPYQDTSADSTGTATHWRLFDSAGVCHLQGDVTATGEGGSMTLASTALTLSGLVQITSWAMT